MWPSQEDVCWVPLTNIVCTIETPSHTTATRRQYYLDPKDIDFVRNI